MCSSSEEAFTPGFMPSYCKRDCIPDSEIGGCDLEQNQKAKETNVGGTAGM